MRDALEVLKLHFGYESFRPMQADIIQHILNGKDALVIMPTGGGKSLCFQIPALLSDGLTVVVSPLIALMQDQVQSLLGNGIPAAYINSSQSEQEQQVVTDLIEKGELKLLYVSPEKLMRPDFLDYLETVQLAFFAIDEAHCISQWGHDFRPEYAQMGVLKIRFPKIATIALTATADALTQKDIAERLSLQNHRKFLASFDRPNLSLSVKPAEKRVQQIIEFLNDRPNTSGIIYCLSRKSCEQVSDKLNAAGFKTAYYHAGMSTDSRSHIQQAFVHDNIPIICATVAFGMGIDKSNIRWVIHHNLPKNMEGYYQEIGRAGRDGLPAETLLLYTFADVVMLKGFADRSKQAEIQLDKLQRMQDYADASTCRRRVLLSYFGESLAEDCGNCDVCANPPEKIDGTIIAQMALSAVLRSQQSVTARLLIDVLRGSKQQEIIRRELDKIKTFGVGKKTEHYEWQYYILQMVNLGLLQIAYHRNKALEVTDFGKQVLKGAAKIEFVSFTKATSIKTEKVKPKVKTKKEIFNDGLFEHLRGVRSEIASERKIAPYLVFSDATLKDMIRVMPSSELTMNQVSGVGAHKLKLYGERFINAILDFHAEQASAGVRKAGISHLISYQMYQKGKSIEEIANERKIAASTVYGHFAKLFEMGHPLEITDFVDAYTIEKIERAIESIENDSETNLGLKSLFLHLNEEVDYNAIKLVIAMKKGVQKSIT